MNYTNRYKIRPYLYEALSADTYEGDRFDPKRISATSLLKPPRVRQLSIRHSNEMEMDIIDNLNSVIGTAFHSHIEKYSKNKNRIKEVRLWEDVDGLLVTGSPDSYEQVNSNYGELDDIKVTSVWKVIYGSIDWTYQLNIYAYLLRKRNFPVNKMYISAICKDWKELELDRINNYPKASVSTIEIPLWSDKKTLEFIKERVKVHKDAIDLPDDKLPLCTKEERWATDDVFAVTRKGKKRSSKNCLTKEEAEKYIVNQKEPNDFYIDCRKGTDRRCIKYCPANKFCSYWKEKYGKK